MANCQSLTFPLRRRWTTKSGIYLPDLLGGVLHCRSICVNARVHSCSHAVESLSTPDGVGVRPPHMVGFAARSRACFRMRFLWREVISAARTADRVTPAKSHMHCPEKMASNSDLLVLDLSQYQPAIVPTPGTGRVSNDLPLGLVQAL